MFRLLFPLCLLLAACATPQEKCASALQQDRQTIDALIEETQANIARGFRYEIEPRSVTVGVRYCSRSSNVGFCMNNASPATVRRAVAIDPAEQARKLAALKAQKARLDSAQCRPDGIRLLGAAS